MIKVEFLQIGDHKVKAPEGLSELLQECWVFNKSKEYKLTEYNRQVVFQGGKYKTKLTKNKN